MVGRLNKAVDPWESSVSLVGRLNKAVDPLGGHPLVWWRDLIKL